MVSNKHLVITVDEDFKRVRDMLSGNAQCSKSFASKIIGQHALDHYDELTTIAKKKYQEQKKNRYNKGKTNYEKEKIFQLRF